MTLFQAVLAICAVFFTWIGAIALFAYRVGRYEANTSKSISSLDKSIVSLEEGRKENRITVERVESSLRAEIKDMRHDIQTRLDALFQEVVRQR